MRACAEHVKGSGTAPDRGSPGVIPTNSIDFDLQTAAWLAFQLKNPAAFEGGVELGPEQAVRTSWIARSVRSD